MEKQMLHTGVRKGEVGRYVFIPGSVERARLISEYFDNPRLVIRQREFLTYTGSLEGVPVTVTSTGIGGPSTSIVLEELHACGADTFVRVGSCASSAAETCIGHVVIPGGAVRMEGTSMQFLPVEFPAVPDYEVFRHMVSAVQDSGWPYTTGVTITKDSFYTEASPETKPVREELLYKWDSYERSGATSTSMECAPLFIIGAVMGLRTASVMISATNYKAYSNDAKDYPRDYERRAIVVAVEGMRRLIRADKEKEAGV